MRRIRENIGSSIGSPVDLVVDSLVRQKIFSPSGNGDRLWSSTYGIEAVVYSDHVDLYKGNVCKTVVFKQAPVPNVGDDYWIPCKQIIDSIIDTCANFDSIGKSTINL